MSTSKISVQNVERLREPIIWVNLCRVIAIYGVVLFHSCQYGAISLRDWLSANFLDSLVSCSLRLLSCALLLKSGAQEDTIPDMARRIAKVLFSLLAWGIVYKVLKMRWHL